MNKAMKNVKETKDLSKISSKRTVYMYGSNITIDKWTAKRKVNEKIDCAINSMYFETPTGKIDWVITLFKCIIRELSKEREEV